MESYKIMIDGKYYHAESSTDVIASLKIKGKQITYILHLINNEIVGSVSTDVLLDQIKRGLL